MNRLTTLLRPLPRHMGVFGPGVPHGLRARTPAGRRRLREIHLRFAAQARGWERDGLPPELVNPPPGYARGMAEEHERLAELLRPLWRGPLTRA